MVRHQSTSILLLSLLGACGESGGPLDGPPVEEFGPPAVLHIVSGNEQRGITGQPLPAPIVLQVLDSASRGVADQAVIFLVVAGRGSVSEDTAYTDRSGTVQVEWTLGPNAVEPQTLYVQLSDDASEDGRIFVTLTAVAEPPSTGLRFASIYAGTGETCALTADGRPYCWGTGPDGDMYLVPTALPGGLTFTTMDLGFAHTCALTPSGAAYCWGQNFYGQLGDGTTSERHTPVPVMGGLTFRAIAAGGQHTCALSLTGEAYCWGENGSTRGVFGGQLGDGTTTSRRRPTRVLGGLTFQSLALGSGFSCGLASAGEAYCWGHRIGTVTGERQLRPTRVPGNLTFTSIAARFAHVCALTAAGAAYCWGQNESGQMGDGSINYSPTPVAVSGGHSFSAIGPGGAHTCGVTTSGSLACWGWDDGAIDSRDFNGGTSIHSTSPVLVPDAPGFVHISGGMSHSCGVTADQVAYCWLDNGNGELGTGNQLGSYRPVPVR